MKPFAFHMAAVSLAACALTAQAEPVAVSAGGTFTLAAFGAGPTTATLHFTTDSVVVNPSLQPNAFLIYDQAVQFTLGNVKTTITRDELGWFNDVNSNGGIDFRLLDVLAPGDMLQFIWSPGVVFSGPLTAPTLDLVTLGPFGGVACYYVARFGACEASYFNDGHYSVTAANSVPVPTTLALLPLALGLAVGATRRRRA